ncbi:MAG: UPF0149 family protein [Rhodospirillales bacterium]|jgi:hypothetical protein|nr:UPF0149 family protein [Rhodospirillales bacterium]MDP7650571.1 UPF0149 family protein [Rhodospirillales bacterium]|tara:strand:+ start:76 stop:726 length:651 start_codon:yes stop_codon:yes gene_type:complete
MKRQNLKYPGDRVLQKLLEKYHCPTPFHVVRMRFLGGIASLIPGVSPTRMINAFWGDNFPTFENEDEASQFFQLMMSLWNRMARHQGGVVVKLVKPKKLREWEDVTAALHMRAEEIRDGFLVGFFGSGEDQNLPNSLEEALDGLKDIADRSDEMAERVQGPQRDQDDMSIADYREIIELSTKDVETMLTAIMAVTKELRRIGLGAMGRVEDPSPLH